MWTGKSGSFSMLHTAVEADRQSGVAGRIQPGNRDGAGTGGGVVGIGAAAGAHVGIRRHGRAGLCAAVIGNAGRGDRHLGPGVEVFRFAGAAAAAIRVLVQRVQIGVRVHGVAVVDGADDRRVVGRVGLCRPADPDP